jgi:cyclase
LKTRLYPLNFFSLAISRAASIILPTSMDGDGTLAGYDLEFTKAIADAVTIPVVASGGAGTLDHFYEGVVKGGAQILLAASVFHFRTFRINEVKEYLRSQGLKVNL